MNLRKELKIFVSEEHLSKVRWVINKTPICFAARECNPGTLVPENPGNPPGFKPVNPGLCAVKNPGFTGLI